MRILTLLLANPGEVVLREELRSVLWPGNAAGEFDHGINVAIQRLRDALGESAERPRFVETVARRGYRFIGEVERITGPAPVVTAERVPAALPPAPAYPAGPSRARPAYGWIAAGILLSVVAFFAGRPAREKSNEAAVIRFNVFPPDGYSFGGQPGPAVSPDGQRVVFVAASKDGYRMWQRSLAVPDPVPIAGADDGAMPFWSPDGRSIAFFSRDGKLKRIDLDDRFGTTAPRTLCDAANSSTGSWGTRGTILFATQIGALYRVPEDGGIPVSTGSSDAGKPPMVYRYPFFLPDGRHFLFMASLSPPKTAHFSIRLGSLDSADTKQVVEADSNAIYVRQRLLYARGRALVAQPFDPGRLATTGNPVTLAEPVSIFGGFGNFSASPNGPLVYETALEPFMDLVRFDRRGKRLSSLGPPVNPGLVVSQPSFSPDGMHLAIDRIDNNNADVWVYNVASGRAERFTLDAAQEIAPVWSPDGKSIVFASSRRGHFDIYRRAASGTGGDELLFEDQDDKYPRSFSPDGRYLLFDRHSDNEPRQSIWALPLKQSKPAFSLLLRPVTESFGEFSPDGRWVVYASEESGRGQVYVVPFSEEGKVSAAHQISFVDGFFPRWGRDGKEIFYCQRQSLKAVPVNYTEKKFEVGKEREFLEAGSSIFGFDISPDGKTFIVRARSREGSRRPLTVAQNWMATIPMEPDARHRIP